MVTVKQIAALKYMIFNAKNGTELSKQILAFLIDQSRGLTKEVCLTLVEGREGYTADEIDAVVNGLHEMQSCTGTTHLDQIFLVTGSEFGFSQHYGDFDPTRSDNPFSSAGMFAGWNKSQVSNPELLREGMPLRYTFWLSRKSYSQQVELIVATRKEFEQIDLKKPGLYLAIEPA